MNEHLLFNFKTDISKINVPAKLNNPFALNIPEIARIATQEFCDFINSNSQDWKYDFGIQKGKMFGVLVVQKADKTYGYLTTVSGRFRSNTVCSKFAPSVFDNSVNDFFIDKGMTELTEMSNEIKNSSNQPEITLLKENRKQKSLALQQQLFENYHFSNADGIKKNVLEIFEHSSQGNPPSSAGECAAPKLLQYAFDHQLKTIAIAEFWWGNPSINKERKQGEFYPACKDKCRPILEYMLDDMDLFNQRSVSFIHPSVLP